MRPIKWVEKRQRYYDYYKDCSCSSPTVGVTAIDLTNNDCPALAQQCSMTKQLTVGGYSARAHCRSKKNRQSLPPFLILFLAGYEDPGIQQPCKQEKRYSVTLDGTWLPKMRMNRQFCRPRKPRKPRKRELDNKSRSKVDWLLSISTTARGIESCLPFFHPFCIRKYEMFQKRETITGSRGKLVNGTRPYNQKAITQSLSGRSLVLIRNIHKKQKRNT